MHWSLTYRCPIKLSNRIRTPHLKYLWVARMLTIIKQTMFCDLGLLHRALKNEVVVIIVISYFCWIYYTRRSFIIRYNTFQHMQRYRLPWSCSYHVIDIAQWGHYIRECCPRIKSLGCLSCVEFILKGTR